MDLSILKIYNIHSMGGVFLNINIGELNFYVKVGIYNKDKNFGAGAVKIMELVKEKGTLTEAYKIMGMSSSKAWKLLKEAEDTLGIKLISTKIGGVGGGKSELTEEGKDFLRRYKSFTAEIDDVAKNLVEKHFNYDIIDDN